MLPGIINLNIRSKNGRGFRLWFPLFVLWPVFLVLFLVALPFLAIAEIVFRVRGIRIRLFRMIWGVFSVLSSLRGTEIKVRGHAQQSIVDVRVQ